MPHKERAVQLLQSGVQEAEGKARGLAKSIAQLQEVAEQSKVLREESQARQRSRRTQRSDRHSTHVTDKDRQRKKMATSDRIQQIDPRLVKNWEDLRDTRAEVLKELGLQEGKELGLQEGKLWEARRVLTRLLQRKFPEVEGWSDEVASIPSLEALEELLDQILDCDDASIMAQRVQQASENG